MLESLLNNSKWEYILKSSFLHSCFTNQTSFKMYIENLCTGFLMSHDCEHCSRKSEYTAKLPGNGVHWKQSVKSNDSSELRSLRKRKEKSL